MVTPKVIAAVLTASSFWAVDAGKCKPRFQPLTHTHPTTLLSIVSSSLAIDSLASSSNEYPSSADPAATVSTVSSDSTATASFQTTTSHQSILDYSISIGSTGTSDTAILETLNLSSDLDSTVSVDTSKLEELTKTATTDTVTISTDTDTTVSTDTTISGDIGISTGANTIYVTTSTIPTMSNEPTTATTTTDTTTLSQSTSIEPTTSTDTTETTATTDTTISIDTAITLISTVAEPESTTTTEHFWMSTTTSASCPVISVSLDDPGFEGDNTEDNRWEFVSTFTPVPFQIKSSTSQDVPRAHTGDQFVLINTPYNTDIWKSMSLDPAKKYQVWFTFAPVPSLDEDWTFTFIISTSKSGHAYKEQFTVPKGSPFTYIQRSTVIKGATGDHLYVFMRANSPASTRYVAVDDIYVAEYAPTCNVPAERTDSCGGIQGFFSTSGWAPISMQQATIEFCARACLSDESCQTFGWSVDQYNTNCYVLKDPKESLPITPRTDGRGIKLYDRSCGQCSKLECLPY